MRAIEQHYHVVLLDVLYNVVLNLLLYPLVLCYFVQGGYGLTLQLNCVTVQRIVSTDLDLCSALLYCRMVVHELLENCTTW